MVGGERPAATATGPPVPPSAAAPKARPWFPLEPRDDPGVTTAGAGYFSYVCGGNTTSPVDFRPMTAPLLEIEALRVTADGVAARESDGSAASFDGTSGLDDTSGQDGTSGLDDTSGQDGTSGLEGSRAQILKGVDLVIGAGEVHALMGPNGAGKSTLASTLMGHPSYKIVGGTVRFKGEDITHWATDARAKAGLFLAFQYPEAIDGVSVVQFLRQAMSARRGEDISVLEVRLAMTEWMERLGMDPSFGERYLNQGFSGGEKKRNEVLQMAMLEPDLAVLDETDSGLDIDALGVVGRGVRTVRELHPTLGVLVVTHYQRILEALVPDRVHLLVDGRIVESGGPDLAERIEKEGYESWRS